MAEVESELGLGLDSPSVDSPVGGGRSFAVGDFVWGKIKSHPWWPGRVFDPSQASDRAKNTPRRDGRSLLVAYFGDQSFAWCRPSQLKPFSENFHQMASSSSAKSFLAALESALDEMGRCLEARMACHCLPEQERSKLEKFLSMNVGISSYSVSEFLTLFKDAAIDNSVVNLHESSMLKSWVVAFWKGSSYIDPSVYSRRRGIADLVDKIDLDAPPAELSEGKEEEDECLVAGGGAAKGPEISPDKGGRNKKKRSVAAIIAEMDSDSVEVEADENEEEKKEESGKGFEVECGSESVRDEEVAHGRRERKKSKYLSPPYTYLSGGITKGLVSPRSLETKLPKTSSRSLSLGTGIMKCNVEEVAKEEEEKLSSPVFKVDSVSTSEVFSEFLSTAVDCLHLKWNRSAKTVKGFFATFRSSMYSSGAEFDTYQKWVAEFAGKHETPVNKEEGNRSKEGKKSEGKRGRKKKDKAIGEGEIPLGLGHQATDCSEKKDKAAPKRKMMKEGIIGETSVKPKLQKVTLSEQNGSGRKEENSNADANTKTSVDMVCEPVNNVESGKTGKKPVKGKEGASKKTQTASDREVSNGKEAKPRQKKRKSKEGPSIEIPVNLVSKITNGSEEGKTGQNKNNKNAAGYEEPAALLLTFSPGISLPSKEELFSTFSKYGPLIESETELLKDSSSARVVFVRSTDAEKAYNDKAGPFGPPVATYRLRYLTGSFSSASPLTPIPVPKPPLPYIRKSLERMISTLNGNAPPEKTEGTSAELKPEARDNLVGEMQGLLMKVNKMLNGPAAGTSA